MEVQPLTNHQPTTKPPREKPRICFPRRLDELVVGELCIVHELWDLRQDQSCLVLSSCWAGGSAGDLGKNRRVESF